MGIEQQLAQPSEGFRHQVSNEGVAKRACCVKKEQRRGRKEGLLCGARFVLVGTDLVRKAQAQCLKHGKLPTHWLHACGVSCEESFR